MEMSMLILAHSKWSLRWLRTNFGSGLWSSIFLKLWRHLVLTRSIVWMLTIWWCRNTLIDLMGSYMSTWSSILRNILVNTLMSHLLWSWSWSWWAINLILMSITCLWWVLFLAHDSIMTCWLSIWELVMLISWSICWSLFDWLIRINRRSMLSMIGSWVTICGHIWQLLFIASYVFVSIICLVLVVLVVTSLSNTTCWTSRFLSLSCLLIFH
jgi:hypothetical protein